MIDVDHKCRAKKLIAWAFSLKSKKSEGGAFNNSKTHLGGSAHAHMRQLLSLILAAAHKHISWNK
jgi:hypothetical protein